MSEPVTTHPSQEALSAFGLGKLVGEASEVVARHLETCVSCRDTVANVPPDSFIRRVQAAGTPCAAAAEPVPARKDSPGKAAVAVPPGEDVPAELASHGKLKVVRKLGEGGMGAVYLAQHEMMGRQVAVKVVNPALVNNAQALERFRREIKAAAQLNHTNIVQAHDAEQVGGLQLLVMEYVEGHSLERLVRQKGPITVLTACRCVKQAAQGLQHAHSKGMVHRDIKPANLMVTRQGVVKILDFGLARLAREQSSGVSRTQSGTFMGTPEFVAPEQATDAATADIRADIYSLGCTLYFLLTGRPPFEEQTAVKAVLAHIEKQAAPVHEVRPEVPAELSAVVAKMMAKEPAARYQTPGEVIQALTPFCKAADLEQHHPATTPAAAPRETILAGGGEKIVKGKAPEAELVLSQGVPDWVGMLQDTDSKKKQEQKTKPARGAWRRGVLLAAAGAAVVLLLALLFSLKTRDGTLVVEVDEPGVKVQVLNEQGKVLIERTAQKGTITISVVPGKGKLRLEKDGMEVFAREFTLASGGREIIRASLDQTPPKAAGTKEMDRERAAAEWVLSVGGVVEVLAGNRVRITSIDQLPPGPFQVVGVSIRNSPTVSDAGLAHLRGLTHMEVLDVSHNGPRVSDLSFVEGMTQLRVLEVSFQDLTDASLRHLRDSTRLNEVLIRCGRITDAGLAHLKGLSELRTLNLYDTKVTDAGLKELAVFRQLDVLQLDGTLVTNAGLKELIPLNRLRSLWLQRTTVTGDGLKDLAPLTQLEELALSDTSVTDVDLKSLTALKGLKSLILERTRVTGQGLKEPGALPQLHHLDLNGTLVTDEDLKALTALKSLQTLYVQGTKVTEAGVKALQAALPVCAVEWSGGSAPARAVRDQERSAAEWILSVGGKLGVVVAGEEVSVTKADQLPKAPFHILWVDVSARPGVTDAGLANLRGLAQVQRLYIYDNWDRVTDLSFVEGMRELRFLHASGTSLTDASLRHLRGLNKLTDLLILCKDVTDAGLEHLKDLKELNHLNLEHTQVSGLAHLAVLPKLQHLSLGATQVTDSSLKQVTALKQLQNLNLSFTAVTDAGLKDLAALPQLQALKLASNRITDAGLKDLAALARLQDLNLCDNQVTDTGLQHLASLQQLRFLYLINTKVTEEGVKMLQQALPACTIKWAGSAPAKGVQDQERAAAEWVLRVGGEVDVVSSGQRIHLTRNTPLPGDSFYVIQVRLQGIQGLTDTDLAYLRGCTHIEDLSLWQAGPRITDLAFLEGMTEMRFLNLDGTGIGDDSLRHLRGLRRLEVLSLAGCKKVASAGLAHLRDLTLLRTLSLAETKVTDLNDLAGLKQLQELNLWLAGGVTDTSLKSLSGLRQIVFLELTGTSVTDIAMKDISLFTYLQRLYLNGTQVTDAGVKDIATLTDLQELSLWQTKVTDGCVKDLQGLSKLRKLNLTGVRLRGDGLKDLKALPQLEWLSLDGTGVTDEGLAYLAPLKKLENLDLWGTPVTDEGLKMLAGHSQLRWLRLGGTKVTDEGLKVLSSLKQLDCLILNETRVTDEGLKDLAAHPGLKTLILARTRVTDRGLKMLAVLKQLETLSLEGTAITDAGLKDLAVLKQLQKLDLRDTPVTEAGVKELRQALPKCTIDRP